jgi:hypothetical protein
MQVDQLQRLLAVARKVKLEFSGGYAFPKIMPNQKFQIRFVVYY